MSSAKSVEVARAIATTLRAMDGSDPDLAPLVAGVLVKEARALSNAAQRVRILADALALKRPDLAVQLSILSTIEQTCCERLAAAAGELLGEIEASRGPR